MIERTMAWLGRSRRLIIRYERREELHQPFLTLARAFICVNHLPPQDGL